MRKHYQRIYLAMMDAVSGMEGSDLPELVQAEKKYVLCFSSWEAVKVYARYFDTAFEEIDFFRNVKPFFTAQIEYFKLIGDAISYLQAFPSMGWHYWNSELGRYARFRERHQSFVDYYESGHRDKDTEYFLAAHYKPEEGQKPRAYDADNDWRTYGDPLIASLQALRQYKEYTEARIRKLSQDFQVKASG